MVADDRRKHRLVGVDLLRLLAIMLVLGSHMWLPPDSWPIAPKAFFSTWHRGGWVGVDLFFVLSGFLVSGLLFSEYKLRRQMSLVRFYTRRGWKIYPPFFLFIGVTILVVWIEGRTFPRSQLASEFFFLQSYIPGIWSHTWSLAVEEHFYLVLPAALIGIAHFNRRSATPLRPIVALALCVAVFTLAARLIHWHYYPAWSRSHTAATHLRLDSLFCGVAIAYVYHFHTSRFESLRAWRWHLIVAGCAFLSPPFVPQLGAPPFLYTVGYTLFYLGSGMILIGVLLTDVSSNRVLRWGAAIGAYSYSIYLWHILVSSSGVRVVERLLGMPLGFGGKVAAYLIGALAVGAVMARAVEFPALKLRDRWFPARDNGPLQHSLSAATHSIGGDESLLALQKVNAGVSSPTP
jgi:peptidoglycan/LPS O-acetylase OafA/YrhL